MINKLEFTPVVNPERASRLQEKAIKILAIQFKSLGDTVLLIPALQAIRNHYPDGELHILVPDSAAPLLFGQQGLTKVWPMHRPRGHASFKQSLPLIRSLRAEGFDRSVDFGGNDRGAILSLLCGARERLGLDFRGGFLGRRFCYTRRIAPAPRTLHETLRSANLLSAWGIAAPASVDIALNTDPALDSVASELLPQGTLLCFIGAGMAKKCWPLSHWLALFQKATAAGYRLAFAGGTKPLEQTVLQELKRRAPGALVLPRLNLATFLAVIKRARAVISNDTGAMHFAATLGVPTIGLFGPTSATQWGPVGKNHQTIQRLNCTCDPSSHACHRAVPCLASISPNEVFLRVQEMLAPSQSKQSSGIPFLPDVGNGRSPRPHGLVELAHCPKRSHERSASPDNSLVHVPLSGASGQRPADHKLIIVAGRCGRLGNRITLFASFVAWAEERGYRLMNPTFHTYAHLFEATRKNIFCQYPFPSRPGWLDMIPGLSPTIRKTRIFTHIAKTASLINERWPIFGRTTMTLREGRKPGEVMTSLESPELEERIRNAKVVLVNGWTFRAPGCVQKHQGKVRAYFRPLAKHVSASQQAVQRLRQHADLVTGVHIRQGDYVNWKQGKYSFAVSRYNEWMTELAGQFPDRRMAFLVCSDEPRYPSEFPGLSVGFSTGEPIEDAYALAECDYIIGPVSSFTQWASFYGNKPLFHLTDRDAHVERERFRVSYLDEVPN